MTKEIAVFDSSALASVLSCLRGATYRFRNPMTSKITGFDCMGEYRELATEEDAIGFLKDGNGVQLWISDSEDVFVFADPGEVCVYFDGFDYDEAQQLMQVFRDAGLEFSLDYDY